LNQFIEEARDRFVFILPETPTIDDILNRARIEVQRNGINGLVIDPWNEIEHSRPKNLTETEYISESLRKMRTFARQNRIHLWIVAHPTKLSKSLKNDNKNQYEIPTPYDIAGSANWRNKADNCVTVYRNAIDGEPVDVHIQKIRFKNTGKVGTVRFNYSLATGMYWESR
ncbi:MAG: DnaB-like helicase C-terminal domain-containing protein, partial [Candidatus Riflebacteria bacterium]